MTQYEIRNPAVIRTVEVDSINDLCAQLMLAATLLPEHTPSIVPNTGEFYHDINSEIFQNFKNSGYFNIIIDQLGMYYRTLNQSEIELTNGYNILTKDFLSSLESEEFITVSSIGGFDNNLETELALRADRLFENDPSKKFVLIYFMDSLGRIDGAFVINNNNVYVSGADRTYTLVFLSSVLPMYFPASSGSGNL